MTNGDKIRERLARQSNHDLAVLILRDVAEIFSRKIGQQCGIVDKNKRIIELEKWLEEEAD